MPKSNICVIGLSKLFADEVCKQLSVRLDMFYANVQDILEYELVDSIRFEEVCGKEYLLKEEMSIIKRICSYENSVININYSNLNNETTLQDVRSSCLVIYLHIEKDRFSELIEREEEGFNYKQINKDLFVERDIICSQLADIVVDCKDFENNDVIDAVIEAIVKYYS